MRASHPAAGPPPAAAAAPPRALPGPALPLLVFLGTALLYLCTPGLGRVPHPDELYQTLAAQGLLATGEPRIAEGLYTRAFAQTWLIAQSLRLFGDTLEAARLSSLLSVAATAVVLFAWLRREAGPAAAWLGGVGFALSPFAVETAHFARIYGVQTLAFLLACLAVHGAVLGPRPPGGAAAFGRRLALAALAAPPLLLAVHLQPTTLLGAAGLALWAAAALAVPPLLGPRRAPARRRAVALLAAASALGALALAGAWASGLLAEFWDEYRSVPLFNRASQNQFWYYHAWYGLLYPTLWPLTGVLAAAALAYRPRPAGLALAVFATGFLLNSFGGPKNLRYLAYAQPFLFALWAIGLVWLWGPLRAATGGLRDRLAAAARPTFPGPWPGRLSRALLAAGLLFVLLANPAWLRTATLLADVPVPGEDPAPDWTAARPALEPLLARVPVVVTTEELGALYYLGRYDVRFSPSKMGEIPEGDRREFAADPRTGRPVIATRESLELVLDCHPEGLFLLLARQWGRDYIFAEPVRRLLLDRAEPVPLPAGVGVAAYAWRNPEGAPRPAACAGLPPLTGPGGTRPPPRRG
jgi:hypothetical protein